MYLLYTLTYSQEDNSMNLLKFFYIRDKPMQGKLSHYKPVLIMKIEFV